MESTLIDVRTGGREVVHDLTGDCARVRRAAAATDCCTSSSRTRRPAWPCSSWAPAPTTTCWRPCATCSPPTTAGGTPTAARGHGRSHVLPALVPPYASLPVLGGVLALGTWQSVALVDLNVDNPDRQVRLSFLPG